MFRKFLIATIMAMFALVSISRARAAELTGGDAAKRILNSINMTLVLVPAGEFKMGSAESATATASFFNKMCGSDVLKEASFEDEHPEHRVRVIRPFYMGAYHVTRGQFRQFVVSSGYKTDAETGVEIRKGAEVWDSSKKEPAWRENCSWNAAGFEQTDDHPVVNVSWNDAVEFCKWLSRKEGKAYRLPTEAEWEYACRAGTTTRYWCGDDPEKLAEVANTADATAKAKLPELAKSAIKNSDGYVFTAPVGSFQPNRFGLYDMHGNAWQWCSDRYDPAYYAASGTNDPRGAKAGGSRVFRGGSWLDWACYCRSAMRGKNPPFYRTNTVGFRIVRE